MSSLNTVQYIQEGFIEASLLYLIILLFLVFPVFDFLSSLTSLSLPELGLTLPLRIVLSLSHQVYLLLPLLR